MRVLHGLIAGLGFTFFVGAASAGVSQQEADQLGKTLTEWGATQAGSADKAVPAYTGGLPANTAPAGWKKGSGRYDRTPYDDEKPLFSINSSNVDKYADHLTEGSIAMLKKYPQYRIDVYPTHRSVSYSPEYLAACRSNALNTTIHADGNGFDGSPRLCVPFPIPKTGIEVMWNHLLANKSGTHSEVALSSWLVDADAHLTDVGHVIMDYSQPYLDPDKKALEALKSGVSQYRIATWDGPPSQVGTKILFHFPMDYDQSQMRTWVYTPGQRRTRLAPEYAYDTPIASEGGALDYDEVNGFDGQPDRFDFKLIGKKEIFVLYNANRLESAPIEKVVKGHLVNPDLARWESHRVWVIDATLKPGKRHVEPHRIFYVDEDTWTVVATDAYDAAGKIFRVGLFPIIPIWDARSFFVPEVFYDLSRGTTYLSGMFRSTDYARFADTVGSYNSYTAAALTSSGIR